MSWITIIWAMSASACLTLALVHLQIWWIRREAGGNLFFALTGMATAVFAGFELWTMRAETPDAFGTALRWINLPAWALVLSLVGFVRVYLRAGRVWLAWTVCGVRTVSLILNLLCPPSLNYGKLIALRHITFLGETVADPEGVPNLWVLIDQLSLLFLVIFIVDAAITVWRRDDRRQAFWVGGIMVSFFVAGTGQAVLTLWGNIHAPVITSLFYMCIVAAMFYELSHEHYRTVRLSNDLHESELRLALATRAANVGICVRDLVNGEIWASDTWRELFGFGEFQRLDVDTIFQRIHPDDRKGVQQTLAKAIGGGGDYEKEYRVALPDGGIRWIASRGRVEFDATGKPVILRGASYDNTALKLAVEAAHDLTGKLIRAQEGQQMRLARDLHDDLSQNLALLCIELEMLGQDPPTERGQISGQMQKFSAQVKRLSSEVHQLSHELHPAKLERLGLEAALRGFCKEFSLAHDMAVKFSGRSSPRVLPEQTALCVYRIAQEALHNVVKHSGGTMATVELAMEGSELRLAIADDGVGFDPETMPADGSLGLVSMSERARFMDGLLSIESDPGKGTRIEVRVPVAVTNDVS